MTDKVKHCSMKANGAPEKIYVHIKDKPCEITFSEVIEKECSNIEYTRTDAFIEKACEWLSDNTLSGLCLDFGNAEIVREFVDNFKNFMKQ